MDLHTRNTSLYCTAQDPLGTASSGEKAMDGKAGTTSWCLPIPQGLNWEQPREPAEGSALVLHHHTRLDLDYPIPFAKRRPTTTDGLNPPGRAELSKRAQSRLGLLELQYKSNATS